MAKRYHGMGHERKSMRKQEGDMSRRTQEMQEADMIREDHSKIANLPQEVMIKPYPQSYDYMPENIDDGIRGVDSQISKDNRKRDEYFRPHKV